MSDQETYTKEELSEMHRLGLRRICKARGMSSEECSKMEFEDMVEWILEKQGGGGGGGKKAPPAVKGKKAEPETKAKPKDEPEPEEGKKAPPKIGGGRKAPPKAPPKGRVKEETSEVESGSETGEVVGTELLNTLLAKLASLEEKIDTLGEVVDTNIGGLVEDMGELRADVYGIARRQKHFHTWMVEEGILTVDPPEGLDLETLEQAIEEECSGNEEGGSSE